VKQAWNGGGPYDGQHYHLEELTLVPQPVQAGGPRVMIGGSGERKTLRLVAQYADACNLFGTEPDDMQHKLEVLRAHCDDVGRNYDDIAKTMIASQTRPLDDVDAWLASMETYAGLGIEQVWVGADPTDPVGWTERMAEQVLPRLAQIG
jgi:alkanesulfonate monooxygenase SsuD/methylene tetrahydromethanopterin reductase-like flavin-dependent oxidoreductase (luciferase family)